MLRFILRTIAVLCLALAVMFIVIDATRSVGASEVIITSFEDSWTLFLPDSFLAFNAWIRESAPAFVIDPVLVTLLKWPTFVMFAVLATVFYVLGHKRRRRAGQFLEN